jgi:hypothetical protein
MKDNDMLLIGAGLIAAYLLLKPKTPTTSLSTSTLLHPTVPTNNTGTLITQGGSLLTNLINSFGGDDTPAPAATPGTPATSTITLPVSSFWDVGSDNTDGDDWENIV